MKYNSKWFHPLQQRVLSYIVSRYSWHQCQYQDVCKDRVYECYLVQRGPTDSMERMLVQMRKAQDDFTTFVVQVEDVPLLNKS